MSNINQMLSQLSKQEQAAFKSMVNMKEGKAYLNPEQLGQFLREATLNTDILSAADFKLMNSFEKNLNKVGLDGRVLTSGYDASGKTRALTDEEKAKFKFSANTLKATKLKACATIEDDELEDNLEQEAFKNTLITMMGEGISEDLEFWAVFADKSKINYSTNKLLNTTDGWLAKAENKVIGGDNFEPGNGVEAMFDKMIETMPNRFRKNRNELVFYVPFEIDDSYRNILKERGTPVGDTTQTKFEGLNYKGIPVEHATTLDAEDGIALDNCRSSILVNPKNMAYGVWKKLSVEPKRIVELEKTEWWFRMRGDVHYYHSNGVVVSKVANDDLDDIWFKSYGSNKATEEGDT